jgi:cytochrome c oxidase cbb3-type subunit III
MSDKREIDDISGVDTTGHEWDGIKELNNPLPRWWLWTLYATIVWAVGYVILYPALPGLSSATKGIWGWSSRGDLRTEMVAVDQGRQEMVNKISTMDIHAILADEKLRTFAVSAGASVFKVNCVQCHGSGAQGGIGYPNLNDDSWLWGGKPEQIQQTLTHGIRSADDPDTRNNQMPAFGKDGILTPEQITQVSNYVFQLGGLEHDATLAAAGTALFAENCVACHGEKGAGNQELGGPQLNDAIWLYGNTPEVIRAQIYNPRQGVMPAWQNRLGETKIKQLTAYVLSLGGGQK